MSSDLLPANQLGASTINPLVVPRSFFFATEDESPRTAKPRLGAPPLSRPQLSPLTSFKPQDRLREASILLIDDEIINTQIVRKYLNDAGYMSVECLSDSTAAIPFIRKQRPDLILLDVMMPQVSGIDILHVISLDEQLQHIPVLIVTATSDSEVRREALDLGATDFLAKPIQPTDLLPRVRNALTSKYYRDAMIAYADDLERQVQFRTAEVEASRREVVHCLARAAEFRDDDTGQHTVRVGRYVGAIARELGYSDHDVDTLEVAAQLHDVGKIAIPDGVLRKPGKLDPEQFEIMQRHCAFGKSIIEPLRSTEWSLLKMHSHLGANLLSVASSPLLMLAARIAQTHHERWDGTGYPLNLAGEDIPIEGRMTAVADVFDALSTKRVYKPAFPREKCFAILAEGRGNHFDPRVVDAFFNCEAEIVRIQIEHMDVP
jgi:putative two-component system response regulator